ncbi:CHST14 [Bugula neritina]|uniref:Carbohydrate sulfotransferase n=1 Tax=Bugula neritina TaxID=10212 RepID=A0A7J7J1K4_BUGNE|nr:CHST14 [Bugula neritina]
MNMHRFQRSHMYKIPLLTLFCSVMLLLQRYYTNSGLLIQLNMLETSLVNIRWPVAKPNATSRVKIFCSQSPYSLTRKYVGKGRSIASVDGNKLVYCPIPKAGWSTWKWLLYRESGKLDTGFQSEWHKIGFKVIRNGHNSHFIHRLIFVRDPYDRLVSAYKDKVLRDAGRYVRQFKQPCKSKNRPPAPALTFSQFIQCIIDEAYTYSDNISTFGTGGKMDIHWRPQTLLCNFCESNFNIIGHLEHMNEDLTEALKVLHMNTTLAKKNASSTNKTKDLPLSYWYNQLDQRLRSDLAMLYSHDFRLLGYDPSPPI